MSRRFLSLLATYQMVTIVILLLLGWILWQIRDLVLLLFLSYILAAALLPLTEFLENHHIPKIFGVLGLLLLVLGSIAFLLVTFAPLIVAQTQHLIIRSPDYVARFGSWTHVHVDTKAIQSFITSHLDRISSNVIGVITNTFAIFLTLSTFLISTFYLLMDHEKIQTAFLQLFSKQARRGLQQTITDINKTLGSWVWGQIILSVFVGILSGLVYFLVGLPFALPLAVFAAIMEIVPTIGPLIAFVPAVFLGLTISPLVGLFVAGGYVAVQVLEGNVLVPKIMQHSVGLHPLAVIIVIVIGAKFFGILGTLLSVPILAVFTVVYNRSIQKT